MSGLLRPHLPHTHSAYPQSHSHSPRCIQIREGVIQRRAQVRASQPPPPRKPAGSHGSTLEAPPQQEVCLFVLLSSRSSFPLCLTRLVLRWLQPCPSSSSLHSPSTTSSTKDHGSSDGLSQSSCEPSVRKSEAHSSKVCPPPPAPPSLFTFPSSSLSLARSLSSLRPPSLFSSRQPRDVLERSLPFPSGMGASDTRPSTRVQQVLLRKQRTRAGRKRAHHPCLACSRLRRRTLVHWMLGLRGACSRLRVGEPLQTIGLSFLPLFSCANLLLSPVLNRAPCCILCGQVPQVFHNNRRPDRPDHLL